MRRLAYFVTHPIQYQAPLLRYLSQSEEIDLEVIFLSDYSLYAHYESAFNQTFKWDTSLTEGYAWEVAPRILLGKSTKLRPYWPAGWLRQQLRKRRFDAVWVHGWGHVGLYQAIRAASSLGLPVLLRGETLPKEDIARSLREKVRDKFYRRLFDQIAGFLCIGSRNHEFYRQFGVRDDRLFSMPYAVDNAFFQKQCAAARPQREEFRRKLDLAPDRPVILFAAKFTTVKAPEELLSAFSEVYRQLPKDRVPYLLFVGDGPLRPMMEREAKNLGDSVRILGFRNQSELPALYDLCDLFVLPSRFEPWGLVVNEAMNAGRPVIVSDKVGSYPDLIRHRVNGWVYPQGDTQALAQCLYEALSEANLPAMGRESLHRINSWDFESDRQGLRNALSSVCKSQVSR